VRLLVPRPGSSLVESWRNRSRSMPETRSPPQTPPVPYLPMSQTEQEEEEQEEEDVIQPIEVEQKVIRRTKKVTYMLSEGEEVN